ncbi:MAG: hypothetical protein NC548_60335, partial [Lachnospiraceae bacterium]|nr:hypothetical protein [Lachnospiraceae bacterium]
LDDVLSDHLARFGKVPIDMNTRNEVEYTKPIELKDTIGFVVGFTDDTVDIELTELGEQVRSRGLLDYATIAFYLLTDGNDVRRILGAKAVPHGRKAVVVFDCDDVLLQLNNTVFSQLWLPLPTSYDFASSGQYKPDELKAIFHLYSNPEIFKIAKFADGADRITDLEAYNAEVRICTTSYNQEVADVKKIRLPEHTKVKPENIEYHIGLGEDKTLPDKADIMVEDCIENLMKLPNDKIKVLIDRPANQRDFAFDFYNKIWRMPDLEHALDFIKYILKTGLIYDKIWRNFNPNEGPYSMVHR